MNNLTFSEMKALRPDEREDYVESVILELLSNDERGMTTSQVALETGFNRITVAKHLENLASIREAYKKQRGGTAVYYRNGKLLHEADKFEFKAGDKVYSFYKLENADGNFIYIQEKVETPLRNLRTVSGIMVDIRDFHNFLKGLTHFGIEASENKKETTQ